MTVVDVIEAIDVDFELQELALLRQRAARTEEALRQRIVKLRRAGVSLKALAAVVGLSESQVSRLANRPAVETGLPAATAMELVRRAQCGEIDHDSFVVWLRKWPYEPQYRTTGLADDGQWKDNSFDAIEYAFFVGLLSKEEYEQILGFARFGAIGLPQPGTPQATIELSEGEVLVAAHQRDGRWVHQHVRGRSRGGG